MKKLLALIMALCLMLTFAACGGNADTPSDTPSDKNSSTGDTTETYNVADFEGVWKIQKDKVDTVKIDAAASCVTAYTADGVEIATFPVVVTADGVVLKMGAFGEVTLKDATSLTVTTVGAPSAPLDVQGEWVLAYGDLSGETNIKIDGESYTITSDGKVYDMGSISKTDNDTYTCSPNMELGGLVTHNVIGGGDVFNAVSPSTRFYVRKSAMDTDTGKALFNYYLFSKNEWKNADGTMDVVFNDNGKVTMSGADVGIWYPTANGVSIEYTDGTKDNVTESEKSITLPFYGTTFTAK
ncbi:MAG: hypothetical protein UIG59_08630 [Acutalibacteraceae bacterium]|nr:hypothetical protein [Acutalibacteraceae bacterium]